MEEAEIFAVIKRNVLVVVPEVEAGEISMDRSLSDLGCNSIDRAEVVSMTLEELRITAPLRDVSRGGTIGQLVAVMRRHA
jgi:polyketide biosynthesis acyl carrier protein